MPRPRTICFALALAAVPGMSARATPLHAPSTAADRQANIEAQHDVALAPAQIPASSRARPLGQLDGAEIALLDGQTEYGPLLRLASPLPVRTSEVSELDQARLDVLRRDAALARQAASSASQPMGAHQGTAQ